jgi:hypothetical protein
MKHLKPNLPFLSFALDNRFPALTIDAFCGKNFRHFALFSWVFRIWCKESVEFYQ